MIDIEEYILFSKVERNKHLKLAEACIDRGGDSVSFRGLLAHILDTSIPVGAKIQLCHACHNPKCSNPNHLYWGTMGENRKDYLDNGGMNIWQHTVQKYGLEQAIKMNKKTPEVKDKISRKMISNSSARTSAMIDTIRESNINFDKFGWVNEVAELLEVSHTHAKRFISKELPDIYVNCFKRKSAEKLNG
jgi:hypothetical protein